MAHTLTAVFDDPEEFYEALAEGSSDDLKLVLFKSTDGADLTRFEYLDAGGFIVTVSCKAEPAMKLEQKFRDLDRGPLYKGRFQI